MIIGGFQKNSLIDFPHLVGCVVFTSGCNFTCPYCHNPELVLTPKEGLGSVLDESDIISFLKHRKGLIDGVVISGGEPCLQEGLADFCFKVKNMGFRVKLDTNGSRPEVIEHLVSCQLVDYIAMDIKTDLDHYGLLAGNRFPVQQIVKSIDIIRQNAPGYEFRTTCAAPFISETIMGNIGKMIEGASLYTLQKCTNQGKVLDPEFLKNSDHLLHENQIHDLKRVIDPFVVCCVVR